jgi:hypothetical protein
MPGNTPPQTLYPPSLPLTSLTRYHCAYSPCSYYYYYYYYYYILYVCTMSTEIGDKRTNWGVAAAAALAPLSGHTCWIVLMVCSRVGVCVARRALVDILK